jgi:hypothetical protein
VVLTAVIVFKAQLRDVFTRVRRGKIFGQEFELDESLDKLERDAQTFLPPAISSPDIPSPDSGDSEQLLQPSPTVEAEVQSILRGAAVSPRAALLRLSSALESAAKRLIAATGHLRELPPTPSLSAMAEILERATQMPRGSLDVFRLFEQVRNKIMHGHSDVDDDEVLRALDSGIVLLRSLAAVPYERNVVYSTEVPIYSDAQATHRSPGWAVILETTSPGGVVVSHRVFPTTRKHFVPGMEVAWEWTPENQWDVAWYRDPDSGDVKEAWGSSLEFVGRDLNTV